MSLINNMTDALRDGIRNFLKLEPAQKNSITIQENLDYFGNAGVNRIWYRGDGDELSQLYKNLSGDTNQARFWAAVPSTGMHIRKIHTGLPGIIVSTLAAIVISDMNDIAMDNDGGFKDIWEKHIAKENNFNHLVKHAISETLVIGDGAFKISLDTNISKYPIIEFVSGENIEYIVKRGRIQAVIFNTPYEHNKKKYVLKEEYGYGYIASKLMLDGKEVDLNCITETEGLKSYVTFDKSFCMAVPFKIYESTKWKDRGKSIFDGKQDAFDAFDESWSQWIDALRKGRTKEYIPSCMIPRSPETGEYLRPNPFDNAYFECESDMGETSKYEIKTVQPKIPHESYLATYITALDLCLQGIISPSTLGIDTKKLDNAEAQREKEKTTLYTRNNIVEALQETLPILVDVVNKTYSVMNKQSLKDLTVDIPFGEYANPSFESQVETVGKGKTQGIMSIEAAVEELYGDTKNEEWKKEEVARLKAEQGIVTDEPEVQVADELKNKIGF